MKEYIEKEKALDAFKKLMEARERSKNCSNRAAMEYNAFMYAMRIIERMEVKQFED